MKESIQSQTQIAQYMTGEGEHNLCMGKRRRLKQSRAETESMLAVCGQGQMTAADITGGEYRQFSEFAP